MAQVAVASPFDAWRSGFDRKPNVEGGAAKGIECFQSPSHASLPPVPPLPGPQGSVPIPSEGMRTPTASNGYPGNGRCATPERSTPRSRGPLVPLNGRMPHFPGTANVRPPSRQASTESLLQLTPRRTSPSKGKPTPSCQSAAELGRSSPLLAWTPLCQSADSIRISPSLSRTLLSHASAESCALASSGSSSSSVLQGERQGERRDRSANDGAADCTPPALAEVTAVAEKQERLRNARILAAQIFHPGSGGSRGPQHSEPLPVSEGCGVPE